ncbi:MAG TPA: copper chaperone PCu(A)C [Turneriella sp.]|nr:copper chaperone PCu(A)C [Turneriella sp.]
MQPRSCSLLFVRYIPLFFVFLWVACNRPQHRDGDFVFRDWYVVKPRQVGLTSVAYGKIVNSGGTPRVLESVSFACADRSTLHETREENGMVRMAALSNVTLKPHETISFEPAGKHVMLEKMHETSGDLCAAVFQFKTESVRFSIPVR